MKQLTYSKEENCGLPVEKRGKIPEWVYDTVSIYFKVKAFEEFDASISGQLYHMPPPSP